MNKNKTGKTVIKKILPQYFQPIVDNLKAFEIRKDEDDIQVNDLLRLREWNDETQEYTGREATFRVTYVLRNVPEFGLAEGYCIISLSDTYLYRG